MAEALYRKYRPQIFEDVVGQEHIERTLKNAIAQDKVSHAYLFTGPRGTGKTTTARLLAKALLCEGGPTAEPDGTCEDCEMIAAGEHPDVYELDAASRTGVENVREEIIGRVQFAPTRGRYKVYIIDEVHMLSTAAFNALLKTLEEPPSHVVFILATTDPQRVPETIHSRCQRFDFRRISTEAMVSRLGAICVEEGVEFEGDALDLIAHRAEGGMRNALTSLEQLIAFGDGAVTMEVAERMLGAVDSTDLADIVRAVGVRDAAACFRWVAEYVETGADMAQFVGSLAEHMRNMYVMAVAGPDVVLDVSEATRRELAEELPLFGADRLARLLEVLGDVAGELKTSTNPRLSFEIALTRMVRPDADLTLAALAERVEALERRLADASVVATATGMPQAAPAAAAVPVATPMTEVPAATVSGATTNAASIAEAAREREGLASDSAGGGVEASPDSSSAADDFGHRAAASAATPSASAMSATQPATAPAAAPASQPVSAPAAAPASQSASAATPQTPAASAPVGSLSADMVATLSNLASLQRLWAGVLASLKKSKAAYGVLFMNTKAVFDGATGTLLIEFPAENDFAFRAVQKAEVQAELALALRQEAHGDIPFELRKAGSAASAAVSTPPAAAAAAAPIAVPPVAQPQSQPAVRSQPQPQPFAQPAASSEPATPPAHEPQAAASAAAFSDDRPPYDDYVPYDDVDIPFEDPFASRAPQPSQAAPAPAASEEVPPWEAAPTAPPTTSVSAEPAPAASSAPSSAASGAAPSAASSVAPELSAASQPSASATGLPPEPDAVSGPSPNPVEEPDLAASLAFGFGDGVNFEEVI